VIHLDARVASLVLLYGLVSLFVLKSPFDLPLVMRNILVTLLNRAFHSSGGWSPASQSDGPGSIPGQVMWDWWWTKWHWGRFSPSTSVSLANSFSAVFHTHHHLSSGAGTIGQIVADVPSGLSFAPPQETRNTLHSYNLLSFILTSHGLQSTAA
jgi:hypothetical protein